MKSRDFRESLATAEGDPRRCAATTGIVRIVRNLFDMGSLIRRCCHSCYANVESNGPRFQHGSGMLEVNHLYI